MRLSAPVISVAAIGLAVALVWLFRPQSEAGRDLDAAQAPPPARAPDLVAADSGAPRLAEEAPAAVATPNEAGAAPAAPDPARSPLPGETPVTPMAQMIADRQQNLIVRGDTTTGGLPPGLIEGEREFAAEPIDEAWAPGAEAALLAKFAQMPGLKLIDLQVECRSTMCRFQSTQPTGPAAQGSPGPLDVLRSELGLEPRWMMSIVDRPDAPNSRSIAYLWREGFKRRECFEDGRPAPCPAEADESGD
jgi:hypothetical protein